MWYRIQSRDLRCEWCWWCVEIIGREEEKLNGKYKKLVVWDIPEIKDIHFDLDMIQKHTCTIYIMHHQHQTYLVKSSHARTAPPRASHQPRTYPPLLRFGWMPSIRSAYVDNNDNVPFRNSIVTAAVAIFWARRWFRFRMWNVRAALGSAILPRFAGKIILIPLLNILSKIFVLAIDVVNVIQQRSSCLIANATEQMKIF